MGASGLQMVMGLFTSILVARALGPDGRGEYALAVVFTGMLVMVVDFGIGMASVYCLGQKKYAAPEILGASTLMALVAAGVMLGVGLVVVWYFRDAFFPAARADVMLFGLLMVPGQVYLNYMTTMLLGFRRVRNYNLIQLLRGVIFLAALVIFLLTLGLGVHGAIGAQVASLLVTSLVLFHQLRRAACGLKFSFGTGLVGDEVRYGLKTYAGTISTFVHERANVLMLNWWTSASAVGLYATAAKLAEETWLISLAAGTVLFPLVAASGGSAQIRDLTPRVCRSVLWITLGMSAILAIPARWVITALFSEAFAAATTPFRILLIGAVAASGSRILRNDLAGRGRPELSTYITIVASVVNVALNVALIPRFDIVGAAWATAGSSFLGLVLSVSAYVRISGNQVARLVMLRWSDVVAMKAYLSSVGTGMKELLVP